MRPVRVFLYCGLFSYAWESHLIASQFGTAKLYPDLGHPRCFALLYHASKHFARITIYGHTWGVFMQGSECHSTSYYSCAWCLMISWPPCCPSGTQAQPWDPARWCVLLIPGASHTSFASVAPHWFPSPCRSNTWMSLSWRPLSSGPPYPSQAFWCENIFSSNTFEEQGNPRLCQTSQQSMLRISHVSVINVKIKT